MLSIAELSSRASGSPDFLPTDFGSIPPPHAAQQEYGSRNQPHQSQPVLRRQAAEQPRDAASKPPRAKASKPAGGAIVFVDPISSFTPGEVSKQRQTVRSLAMRAARKERWWSTKKDGGDATTGNVPRVRKKPTRSKGKAPAIDTDPEDSLQVQLMRRPSTVGSAGPYEALILNDNHTAALVNHYIRVVSPNRPQVGEIRSTWFQLAQSNSAFLNTLLCMSAMHLYAMGTGTADLIYFHKAKVIAGINANMSNDAMAMSPANLAAVCNLYCIERSLQRSPWDAVAYMAPTPHRPEVHRQGLQNMVDHRGGLETLAKDRLLYSYILWLQTLEDVSDYFFVGSPRAGHLTKETAWPRPKFSAYEEECPLPEDSEVLPLGNELMKFAKDMSRWCRLEQTQFDAVDLLIRCCGIQLRLLELLRSNPNLSGPQAHENISCIGMLAFSLMATGLVEFNRLVIQDNPAKSKWYSEPKQRVAAALRKALEWCPRVSFSNESRVWLHVIGAICSEGSPDRQWFVEQCPPRNPVVATADSFIELFLDSGLWIAGPYDDAARMVYNEIESASTLRQDQIWQESHERNPSGYPPVSAGNDVTY